MSDSTYFASTLYTWFATHGRKLPWRNAPSPYQVWVSELMLQQTQVATVIPYYERWMTRFPTLESLANAELDEVLKLWSGLGYYRRARYLHEGSRVILSQFGGQFPQTIAELRKIPGIGAYTAGAVTSFAFGQNEPAIDGNVDRVLSRFFGITLDLSTHEGRQIIEERAHEIAHWGHANIVNQAIMDLGASCCSRIAHCASCPLFTQCEARRLGLTESLPLKKRKCERYREYRAAIRLISPDNRILLAKRRADQLLGGLWEYPMITLLRAKMQNEDSPSALRMPRESTWKNWLSAHGQNANIARLVMGKNEITHIFTHIQMHVVTDEATYLGETTPSWDGDEIYDRFEWVKDIHTGYALSSLMKKLG